MKINFSLPKLILPYIKNRMEGFYLVGGTALSMFYYEHRESYDLDFFTKDFSQKRIIEVMDKLKADSNWTIELVAEQNKTNFVRVAIYMVNIGKGQQCKIDFVEDYIDFLKPFKRVDGIDILSLEDIYLRKVYTMAGHILSVDEVGQKVFLGGRHEAKDFYDVYCLSTITMPLSEFASLYCNNTLKEGIIRWYNTFDRMKMKTDLLDLITKTNPDYSVIEKHFKREIDKILETLIEEE